MKMEDLNRGPDEDDVDYEDEPYFDRDAAVTQKEYDDAMQ